ncbi:MAG TPA: Hsp70 family protein [Phycisphaerae bacterium]|nr:Hsp70 family protein [Phycisphaerae bacterium]
MKPTLDFGIDLGTTNSSVACCRNGQVKLFPTNEMMTVTPSVVYIGRSGRMLVGKRAYDAWPADPENAQAEFKRWMGFSDKLHFPASNRTLSAEELSAEVLKSLRADVQRGAGVDLTAAVITVPAAFGVLQCDATGRAARLAGFTEAPLLQEPIAAAIAYGASAAGKQQRWIIFDLGGGTLDIAVVSTRNGRLAVLEHQGNNRLGGKDIDRIIADEILLPQLAERFKLPDRQAQPAQFNRLFRALVRVAEQAKIALTTADSAPVDVFNIGDDLAGAPIEHSVPLTRSQLEKHLEPLLAKCLQLTQRALDGARMAPADIDRVIMVGGPTQMPIMRQALISLMGDKLDYSIDPMTVVAQGAALYASTLERTSGAGEVAATAAAPGRSDRVAIKLNHERASGTPKSPIAGTAPAGSRLHEIKIDADGGVWSSGWIPLNNDRFVTEVLLSPGKSATRFALTGRSKSGNPITVEPAECSIAYMLPMGAPPLPHTIAIELDSGDSREHFDPVFKRHTPLPSEARKTYRADRSLRPSEIGATLPIKFWEIDVSEDPQEKWWAGCVHIQAEKLKRPLSEGTELALTVKIDKSRKLTIEVFIPSLNQGFTDEVFVPDPPTTRNQLQQQLDLCFERVHKLFDVVYAGDLEDYREKLESLQFKLEVIAEQIHEEQVRGNPDPDALLGPSETLRKIRILLTQIEEQLESERKQSPQVLKLRSDLRWTQALVEAHGSASDRETLARLDSQLQRYIDAADQRGMKFVDEQLIELRGSILVNQRWFFDNWLRVMKIPGMRFLNQSEARVWLQKAEAAAQRDDFPGLRDAIRKLWALQPPDQVEAAKEQAMRSGLKGT